MRTYSGHSSARASNELYRTNLAKGQTGLSVAFDLPTQTGYDPDHILARGEVGKVGVPVPHLGEMRTLFDGIPLDEMNTSMTINATAMWLFGMYLALAEEQGVDPHKLARHDAERHRQGVPVAGHVHLPARGVEAAHRRPDRATRCSTCRSWNPINVCPYHFQEAGATPVQEIAYGLAHRDAACSTRCASRARSPRTSSPQVVGRISFFIDAGVRFVEEMCKMRAFTQLWDRIYARALRRRRTRSCAASATACR